MSNDFRLSEADANTLRYTFMHRRDVAESNNDSSAASAWSQAAEMIRVAQEHAFKQRHAAAMARKTRKLGLRPTR
jgi:hypothetical protein